MTARGTRQRPSTPEERAIAVALYEEFGPAEAGRRVGRPKATVSLWARKAGASTRSSDQIEEMIRQREARRHLSMQEWREQMTDILRRNSLLAAERENAFLQATGAMAPSMERVTTSRVKATSDLLLLSGEATSRSASLTELPAAAANAARLRDELAERRKAK